MIKIGLIFILLFVLYSVSGQSRRETGARQPSPILNLLQGDQVEAISKARVAYAYSIKSFITEKILQAKKGKKYFADYEVLESKKFNKRKLAGLKGALLDPNIYTNSDYIRKCVFTASVGFELISKGKPLYILISRPCEQILFIRKGKEYYVDLRSVEPFTKVIGGVL